VCRLQADMIVTRSPRIQAGHDCFQRIPAAGVGELMSSATITSEVVFTSVVGMPKIKKGSGYRIPLRIENKSSELDRNAAHSGFTKIGFGRRIRSEEWPGCFLRGELQRLADGRRGCEDQLTLLPADRSCPQKESQGSSRGRQGVEKVSPRKGPSIGASHEATFSQGKEFARRAFRTPLVVAVPAEQSKELGAVVLVSCSRNKRAFRLRSVGCFSRRERRVYLNRYVRSEQRGKTANWPRPTGLR